MKNLLYFFLLINMYSCQKNQLAEKSSLFREAIKTAFLEYENTPFLRNDIFSDFSEDEIEQYRGMGINIWKKDELFMLGIREFISIYQIELHAQELEINFFLNRRGQGPQPESIKFRIDEKY